MGFFDFLKKKNTGSKISVKTDELDRWIDNNISEKREIADSSVSEIYKELNKIIDKTRADIKELREYEIRNAKTADIVSKYREIYAKFVDEFIEDISKNKDKKIDEFIVYYINRKASFSKQSFKSFHVTSELIGKPLEKLIADFKAINIIFKRIAELIDKEISKADNLKKSAFSLSSLIKLKRENELAIVKTASSIDELNKHIGGLKTNDETIKKSEKYLEKEKLKLEISGISGSIRQKKETIVLAFNGIQKSLKRFEWTEQNKHTKELLHQLIESPWDALISAKDSQISSLLDTLRNQQVSELKEKEDSGKIENALSSLKIIGEINHLEHNLMELSKKEESIKLNWGSEKIRELEDDIKTNGNLKENCEEKQKQLSNSIELLKKEIEIQIAEYLGKKVVIIEA